MKSFVPTIIAALAHELIDVNMVSIQHKIFIPAVRGARLLRPVDNPAYSSIIDAQ